MNRNLHFYLYYFSILFFIFFTTALQAEQTVKYTIHKLEFSGNTQIPNKDLVSQIPITIGQEYSRDSVIEGKYNLLSFYGERGYIYAKVKEITYADETTGEVTIGYEITEGKKAFIGKITLVGNTKTKDRVIRRQLSIHSGEIYNRKQVYTSQRKLMLLGIFDEVKIEPAQPEVESEVVDLIVSVKERKTGVISLGAGYSTEEGIRGYSRYRQTNLFGKGQRFGASVYWSEKGELVERGREIKLDFFEPSLYETDYGFGAELYYRRENLDNYSLRRLGSDIYLTRLFEKRNTRATLKYRFEKDQTFDFKNEIDTEILSLDGKKTDIGSFSLNLTRDTRDNIAYPHRGNIQSLTLEFANDLIGSQADFVKVIGDFRTYHRIMKSDWVLGLRATGGVAQPYGGLDELPIFERLYAGGADSVRGFEERYLGPKDKDGYPVGGEAMVVFNAELRFPVYKQLGGVVFYDCGNVWAKPAQIDLSELESAVGVGVRYQTPIGPFRLDYGLRIPKVDSGRFHISVGQTF